MVRSEASQGKTGWYWSSPPCGLARAVGKTGSVRVCEPAGTGGCYQQTYNEQSDTGGGVLARGHAESWASCAETEQGSLECWRPESCSGRKHLKKQKNQ